MYIHGGILFIILWCYLSSLNNNDEYGD